MDGVEGLFLTGM